MTTATCASLALFAFQPRNESVRDLIDRMFGGSSEELVMSLLRNGEIDARKLAELTEQFNQKARKP